MAVLLKAKLFYQQKATNAIWTQVESEFIPSNPIPLYNKGGKHNKQIILASMVSLEKKRSASQVDEG